MIRTWKTPEGLFEYSCVIMALRIKDYLLENKLIGEWIHLDYVEAVTGLVGCATSWLPFLHLSILLGQSMSRIEARATVFERFTEKL